MGDASSQGTYFCWPGIEYSTKIVIMNDKCFPILLICNIKLVEHISLAKLDIFHIFLLSVLLFLTLDKDESSN